MVVAETGTQTQEHRDLARASWLQRLRMIDLSSPRHADKLGYILLTPAVLLIFVILVYPILSRRLGVAETNRCRHLCLLRDRPRYGASR